MATIVSIKNIPKQDASIEICSNCKGEGKHLHFDMDPIGDVVVCRQCSGTGRIKTVEAVCIIKIPFDYQKQ